MKIAVLLSRFPYPLERGDKLRVYHQIKYLSNFHELYLFAVNDDDVKAEWLEELRPFCKEILTSKITLFDKILGGILALKNGWPLQSGICYKTSFQSKINDALNRYDIDLVYCQLIRMAPYCESIALPKILDYMDAMGESMQKRAGIVSFPLSSIYKFESKRVHKYEYKCAERFDRLTIISHNDKLALGINNLEKVEVISNGIDTIKFTNTDKFIKKFDVGFIGNLGYLPNIEAAEYLVENVAKTYYDKYGKRLKILIAGARPDARIKRLSSEDITVAAWVENIVDSYQSISILCAPIFSSTGQQNKILESMACAIPVICNIDLNASINAVNNKSIITTRNLEEMVSQIHLLLSNPDLIQKIGFAGQEFVRAHFTWDSATNQLLKIIDNTAKNSLL